MMKTFYTFVLLLLFITLNAQILYKENFETLNSGTIVGQGNYTLHSGTAIVIQDGTNKVLSIGGFADNGLVELGTGDFQDGKPETQITTLSRSNMIITRDQVPL